MTRPYLICATPRSGSTFLCNALQQTGYAGSPTEYFLPRIKAAYMEVWEDTCPFSFASHLLANEATSNGIFGAKVMYPCLDTFLAELNTHSEVSAENEALLMEQAFPGLRWIFIERRDRIRQAISVVKAQSTGVWHRVDDHQLGSRGVDPRHREIGVTRVLREVQKIKNLNHLWEDFFSRNDLVPYRVCYEELVDDYDASVRKILDFIGLDNYQSLTVRPARTEKLADSETEKWVNKVQRNRRWESFWLFAYRIKKLVRKITQKFFVRKKTAGIEPHLQRIRHSKRIIEDFEIILQFNPNSLATRTVLGIHHERLNQIDQAKSQYRQVLSQDPKFLPVIHRMAHLSSKPD